MCTRMYSMATENRPVIEAAGLGKSFGTVAALSGVSLTVPHGTLVGLVGPDGAGKSTLMRIVLTLLRADCGRLRVFGLDPETDRAQIRSRAGYMPETFSLYSDLTVEENLLFSFRIHQMDTLLYRKKLDRLYGFNRLEAFARARVGTLSGGMKQKLALSCALIHDPDMLVLDEPTTGVDPLSRREFWKMLHELRDSGLGILVSTPYMDEALQCDIVYFMFHGRVLDEGSPDTLISSFYGTLYELVPEKNDPGEAVVRLHQAVPEAVVYLSGRNIHFGMYRTFDSDPAAVCPGFSSSRRIAPDLEDLFMMRILNMTGRTGSR